MDYRELLKRYMREVEAYEGTDFIDEVVGPPMFNLEQAAALLELRAEIKTESDRG